MTITWTENETEKLIILYSQYKCLRIPFFPDFNKKLCQYKAYKHIVRSMNIPGLTISDCIKKINQLKRQYSYELTKIGAGILCGKCYEPKENWFKIMHELLFPYMQTSNGDYKSIIRNFGDNHNINQNEIENDPYTNNYDKNKYLEYSNKKKVPEAYVPSKEDVKSTLNLPESMGSASNVVQKDNVVDKSSGSESIKLKQIKSYVINEKKQNNIQKNTSDAYTETDIKKTKENYDEFDIFGESVACQLRNIDIGVALQLKKKIQALISEKRIGMMKETLESYSSCSCCRCCCNDSKEVSEDEIFSRNLSRNQRLL